MTTEVCLACSVERDFDELSEEEQSEYYIDYDSFDILENGQNPCNYVKCCYLCEQHKYLRDYEIDNQTDNQIDNQIRQKEISDLIEIKKNEIQKLLDLVKITEKEIIELELESKQLLSNIKN